MCFVGTHVFFIFFFCLVSSLYLFTLFLKNPLFTTWTFMGLSASVVRSCRLVLLFLRYHIGTNYFMSNVPMYDVVDEWLVKVLSIKDNRFGSVLCLFCYFYLHRWNVLFYIAYYDVYIVSSVLDLCRYHFGAIVV